MADFSILHEVVPELKGKDEEFLRAVWMEWVNEQPDSIRQWLTKPLSQDQRRVLQCQFAVDWYRARSLEAQDRVAAEVKPQAERNLEVSYPDLVNVGQ